MRVLRTFSLFSLASILVASCAPAAPTTTAGDVQTVVAVTFAAMSESAPTSAPEATFTAIPSPTLVASSTPPSPTTFTARTSAQNVSLRVGPGSLFKVSRVMAQGLPLQVLGRSQGGEWLYVLNEEGINGWVSVLFVDFAFDGPLPPFVEPENALLVTGTVHTELGTPVSGIGFAIEQGSNRADTQTDDTGRFYAYLPAHLSGAWTVSYVSIACTSNTMDSNCNCISGTCASADPPRVTVNLPSSSDLNFVWK